MAVFGDVWGNFLTLAVLSIIFWMVWRKMQEGKVKEGIRSILGKLK